MIREYEVNLPDHHGDEWSPVAPRYSWLTQRGFDNPEDAAEAWCAHNHANLDYPVSIDGLRVRRVDQPDAIDVFDISVESLPHFSVRKVNFGSPRE